MLTLYSVRLSRVGDAVREHQAVLPVHKILDHTQQGVVEEVLLAGVFRKDPCERELVAHVAESSLAALEGKAVLWGVHEETRGRVYSDGSLVEMERI